MYRPSGELVEKKKFICKKLKPPEDIETIC